ncbi:MAG: polysaccharide biosynthesis protein, partial [Proteobacteria bacterium]|nr:polysaccharide biosynthesis protein [Pseudomonadota bacterium]
MAKHIDGEVFIFSRNEKDQVIMKKEHPEYHYIIGDVRDTTDVFSVVEGMDYVFHFAALKHIDICERQPQEAVKTNINGTMNVTNACRYHGVKLVNMSSDKAISPTSVYGMTKSIAEKIAGDYLSIRSGNVLWSSGSVFPIWKKQIEQNNKICLTSELMTRFFVHPKTLALYILKNKDKKGVLTIPMKSFRLYDIALRFIEEFGREGATIEITGLRPGERLHEFRDEETSSE